MCENETINCPPSESLSIITISSAHAWMVWLYTENYSALLPSFTGQSSLAFASIATAHNRPRIVILNATPGGFRVIS